MKNTMNKIAAVMAAVIMAGIGYVAGRANTPAEIETDNVIVAQAAAEVEEPEIEEQVEEEKEIPQFEGIWKIKNGDGTLRHHVVLTDHGYAIIEYLPDAVGFINVTCNRSLTYGLRPDGKFQVTDETGRAVHIEVHTITD